jgi:perosamine synthetase
MIPVNEPLLDGNEAKYVIECIKSGWISAEGPFVRRFEEEFSAIIGRKFGIAICNGSFALEAGVVALGIGPGDEVIMPTFTIISCASAVIRAGAIPVVVDCDPFTWNMDASHVEAMVTSRTKAILVAHTYGLPTDLDQILAIAARHGLLVIEDAAEMHGQTYKGRRCGSFGNLSTFSFYANKHVTTGEGGMILTDSEDIAEHCRQLRNLCFQPGRRFVHEELGWNMRMTSLQAAVGVAQLERLDEFVARKRRMGRRYTELLVDLSSIQLPLPSTNYAENIYWVYGVVLDSDARLDATEIMEKLAMRGVATRPFFWPMHEQPVLQHTGFFRETSCPVAERIARHGFYLPSGLALKEHQIMYVADVMHELLA